MIFANEISATLFEHGTKRIFMKNSNIYKINIRITYCYFSLSGTVKNYINHKNGRRFILDFAGYNDWLGELSLFYNETDIKENMVLHEVECLEFDIDELRKLCKEDAKT